MKTLSTRILVVTLCLLFSLPAAPRAGEVNLSAAASLKDALNELAASFIAEHPGVTLIKNYGGSGALAQQIANGAPADLFISANPKWMDHLKDKGLVVQETIAPFAYNTLVFAGPSGKAAALPDLLKLERIAIGSPKSVPAGDYALTALEKAGLATALKAKLVMAKDVRECLMYAERGEVDGAFVYRTDALLAGTVAILFTVPPQLYPPVTYPVALTLSGAGNADAVAFLAYLQGPTGRAVLEKYGFMTK